MIQEKFFAYLACMITYGLLSLCSTIVLVRAYLYGRTIFKRFSSMGLSSPLSLYYSASSSLDDGETTQNEIRQSASNNHPHDSSYFYGANSAASDFHNLPTTAAAATPVIYGTGTTLASTASSTSLIQTETSNDGSVFEENDENDDMNESRPIITNLSNINNNYNHSIVSKKQKKKNYPNIDHASINGISNKDNSNINNNGTTYYNGSHNHVLMKPIVAANVSYEASSSFTDMKLIMVLILVASVVRFVQFVLQTFVQHFQEFRSMEIVVSTFPVAVFMSIELLLVFFWAETVHRRKNDEELKLLFKIINLLMYLLLCVCDCLLIYQFVTVDQKEQQKKRESDDDQPSLRHYSTYEIISVVYLSALFMLTALSIAIYGSALIVRYNRMAQSELVRRTVRTTVIVTTISTLCLLSRAAVLTVQMFVVTLETRWFTIVSYYILGEIIPLSLLVYLLNTATKQQSTMVTRLNQQTKEHVKKTFSDPVFITGSSSNESSTTDLSHKGSHSDVVSNRVLHNQRLSVPSSINTANKSRRSYSSHTPCYPSMLRYSPTKHQISVAYNYGDNCYYQQGANNSPHNNNRLKSYESQSSIQTTSESQFSDEEET